MTETDLAIKKELLRKRDVLLEGFARDKMLSKPDGVIFVKKLRRFSKRKMELLTDGKWPEEEK